MKKSKGSRLTKQKIMSINNNSKSTFFRYKEIVGLNSKISLEQELSIFLMKGGKIERVATKKLSKKDLTFNGRSKYENNKSRPK